MPSVFLSHNSADKPFVEKLANDLRKIGVDVWFDKWEIKIGESLTWKIEQGIRENEYLAIVLSPEAVSSEWVRSELGAAWAKQMLQKKVIVLPVLYRNCELPSFLIDRRYADFRSDYQSGFRELASALGIRDSETVSIDNWRRFAKARKGNWQAYRIKEFENLVTVLADRAIQYRWSSWVGSRNNHRFAITFTAEASDGARAALSIKLVSPTYAYMASTRDAINPGGLASSDFNVYVGNSVNECEEYVWRTMEDFKAAHGDPTGGATHLLSRFLTEQEKFDFATRVAEDFRDAHTWYRGEGPPRYG